MIARFDLAGYDEPAVLLFSFLYWDDRIATGRSWCPGHDLDRTPGSTVIPLALPPAGI